MGRKKAQQSKVIWGGGRKRVWHISQHVVQEDKTEFGSFSAGKFAAIPRPAPARPAFQPLGPQVQEPAAEGLQGSQEICPGAAGAPGMEKKLLRNNISWENELIRSDRGGALAALDQRRCQVEATRVPHGLFFQDGQGRFCKKKTILWQQLQCFGAKIVSLQKKNRHKAFSRKQETRDLLRLSAKMSNVKRF